MGYYLLKQEDQEEERVGSGMGQPCPIELPVMVEMLCICAPWST